MPVVQKLKIRLSSNLGECSLTEYVAGGAMLLNLINQFDK